MDKTMEMTSQRGKIRLVPDRDQVNALVNREISMNGMGHKKGRT
jgi:hypothetical protein